MGKPVDHYTKTLAGHPAIQSRMARVVWSDGRLYVFPVAANRKPADPVVFDAPDPPANVERSKTKWSSAGLTWVKAGCPCGFPGAYRVHAPRLLADVGQRLAAGTLAVHRDTETVDA